MTNMILHIAVSGHVGVDRERLSPKEGTVWGKPWDLPARP